MRHVSRRGVQRVTHRFQEPTPGLTTQVPLPDSPTDLFSDPTRGLDQPWASLAPTLNRRDLNSPLISLPLEPLLNPPQDLQSDALLDASLDPLFSICISVLSVASSQ